MLYRIIVCKGFSIYQWLPSLFVPHNSLLREVGNPDFFRDEETNRFIVTMWFAPAYTAIMWQGQVSWFFFFFTVLKHHVWEVLFYLIGIPISIIPNKCNSYGLLGAYSPKHVLVSYQLGEFSWNILMLFETTELTEMAN